MSSWDVLTLSCRIIGTTSSVIIIIIIIIIIITTTNIADSVHPIFKAKGISPFTAQRILGVFYEEEEDYYLAGIGCQYNFGAFFSIEI